MYFTFCIWNKIQQKDESVYLDVTFMLSWKSRQSVDQSVDKAISIADIREYLFQEVHCDVELFSALVTETGILFLLLFSFSVMKLVRKWHGHVQQRQCSSPREGTNNKPLKVKP